MADIVITTDFSQVNALNNTLKSTDNLFTKVIDSLLREETRARRVTKALAKTTEENLALIEKAEAIVAEKVQVAAQKREKARQREAERAEREAKRIAAAAEKAAKAEAKLAQEIASNQAKAAQQSTANLNQRLGVTGSSAMNSGAGFGALDQEIERLRQKYDKIYSASQLYERSLEELNRAHMLGITSVKQHESAIEQLNMEYQQFSNAAEGAYLANNRFSQHINQTGRGLNNFGFVAQQVGYQVGDFFVQMQSGTNVFVAFGQQATQLAGLIPGIYGAIAGIGISLATAYLAYRDRASEATQETNNLKDSLKSLEDQTRATKNELLAVATGYQTATQGEILRQIISLEVDAAALRQQAMEEEGFNAQARMNDAIALEKQAEALRKKLEEQRVVEEQLLKAKANQELKATAIKDTTETLKGIMQTISTMDLSAPFKNLLGPIQAAIDKARELAANNGGMVSGPASNNINGLNNLNLPLGMVPPALGGIAPSSSQRPQARPTDIDFGYYPDTKSGGGSSRTNPVEGLINQLQTERETIQEWYTESQDLLKSASESELQIIGGYNEAKLRLEKEYQDRLKGIRDEGNATALGDAATFFGGMAAVAQAGGDRTVKAMRIFSAAQALINSYVAFTEVLKDPSFIGRPFARFGAAASALSSGLAAVAAIKGGGSSGGSMSRGSATVAASSGSAPAPQTVFIDSISPESLYSGETLINLFEAFYDENDKRGKVFMVAR